jgi:hypothetical protein
LIVAAIWAAGVALTAGAPVAFSTETHTGAVIDSEATHSLGGGNTFDHDPGLVAGSSNGEYISVGVEGWSFFFGSNDGSPLTPGTYSHDTVLPSGGWPTLSVTRGSSACTATGWRYTILEGPTFTEDDTLTGFAADLVHHCSSRPTVPLFASIRLASSIPTRMVHVTQGLTFPDTVEGTQSAPIPVTIENLGQEPVEISHELVGQDPTEFGIDVDGCGTAALEAGASCDITLVFSPTSTMDKSAVIEIVPAGALEPRRRRLSGYGLSVTTLLPMRLALSSDAGDWVGDGDNWLYDPAEVVGEAYGYLIDGEAPGVSLESPEWPAWPRWHFGFFAAEGETLGPGHREVPAAGFMDVSGYGHGCNFTSGWFEVLEGPTYDADGTLLTFAADFEQHCEDAVARLRGSIRFHTTEPLTDLIPPIGSSDIEDGADYTDSATVTVSVPATDSSDVTMVALSNDGETWITSPYSSSMNWTLSATDGTRAVLTRWRDGAANWSSPASDTIVLDTTAPSATGPKNRFLAGGMVNSGRLPVRLSWSGSDATSGIARYQLAQSTDGGPYVTVSAVLTGAALTRRLAAGHTYRFRVRAIDRAGNLGGWAYGTSFRVSAAQESSSRISYAGTWWTGSNSAYWGGKDRYASAAGAEATFKVNGRSVAWIAATGPTRGSARVYVNGVHVDTVSLYAATSASRLVVWTRTWSSSTSRTIIIRVSGTAGHPRVDLDAIAWGS